MSAARVARGFDRLAPVYDLLVRAVFGGRLRAWHRTAAARAAAAERVLVVGPGTGAVVVDLLRARPGRRVWCLDVSPGMLAATRRRVEREAPGQGSRVRYLEETAARFELGARFDAILAPFVLDCFGGRDVDRVVACLDRHLVAGGRVVVSDFTAEHPCLVRVMYAFFGVACGLGVRELADLERPFRRRSYRLGEALRSARGLVSCRIWYKP